MFYVYFIFVFVSTGGCDQNFSTITVLVGQDVTFKCNIENRLGDLQWTRLTSDNLLEVLVSVGRFGRLSSNKIRLTAKRDSDHFDLNLSRAESGDTGFYYCSEVLFLKTTFMNTMFLHVKDRDADVTDVVQTDLLHSGTSGNLQCSLLTKKKNSCSGKESVYWFKSGADKAPHFLLARDIGGDECEENSTIQSRKCLYNLSRDVSSSHHETLYCAVVSCGHIFFGNRSKDSQGNNSSDFRSKLEIVFGAGLAICLLIILLMTYIIWKLKQDLNKSSRFQPTSKADDGDQQQDNSESLVYTVPSYTKRRSGRKEKRVDIQENVIYSGVNVKE